MAADINSLLLEESLKHDFDTINMDTNGLEKSP